VRNETSTHAGTSGPAAIRSIKRIVTCPAIIDVSDLNVMLGALIATVFTSRAIGSPTDCSG
jgi:hypothetical protein